MDTLTRRRRLGAKRTGEILVDRGVLTAEQLEQALAHQKRHGGRLGEVILRLGFGQPLESEREIAFALTAQYGVPYLSLEHFEIQERVVQLVPEAVARRYRLIPVDCIGNTLSIAMADPTSTMAIRDLEARTRCTVQPFISTPADIQQAIDRYYKKQSSQKGAAPLPAPRRRRQARGCDQRASLQARVLNALVANGLLKPEQVQDVLALQQSNGGRLLQTLVDRGLVQEVDMLSAVSQGLALPLIHLSRVRIDPALKTLIPHEFARHERLIPVSRIGQTLTVAMADPLNVFTRDALQAMTGLAICPVLARSQDIREALDTYYGGGVEETVRELVKEQADAAGNLEVVERASEETDANRLLQLTRAMPVVQITDALLTKAVCLRASDLLIEPSEEVMFVRFRVDGLLQEGEPPPRQFQQAVISRLKVMAELNIAERRLPQDGHFGFQVDGRMIDFRVSVLPSVFGEKVALRVLDKSQVKLDVQDLGFDARGLKRLLACVQQPHGMILATGPTGSGKTTTLYALLKSLDEPEKNLVTVEDPVEFKLGGINQVSTRPEIGLTFARALRFILRQDPDIIMVGEIRDTDTADMAVKSALTGHLVLSTLHTTSATGAIVRLINMGVEPFLLNSCLLAVIGQRLVRRLCRSCQQLYTPSKGLAQQLGLLDARGEVPQLSKAVGCGACAHSGYHGRELIGEVFVVTPEIRKLIAGRAGGRELEEAVRRAGMQTLREHAIEKARQRLTSLEEVFRMTVGEVVET